MSKKIIKGDELQIFVDGLTNGQSFYCPLYATSHTVTLTGNTIDISTKDHGFWGASSIGNITWELTAECLLTENDFDMFFYAMTHRSRLQCTFAEVNNYSVNGLIYVGGDVQKWVPSAYGKQGYVVITSLTCNANTGENSTYSITFTGQGALKKYNLTNLQYKVQVTYPYLIDPQTMEGVEMFNISALGSIVAVRVGNQGSGSKELIDMNGSNVYPLDNEPQFPLVEYTFYGPEVPANLLKEMNLPDTVKINEHMRYIGENAFRDSSISDVKCDNETIEIGQYAFSGCSNLETFNEVGGKNNLGAKSIGNSAFNSCVRLTNVNVGNSCRSIGNNAFNGCIQLASVMTGEALNSIGNNAFLAPSQRDINIGFSRTLAPTVGTLGLGQPTMLTVTMYNAVDAESFTNNWALDGWNQYEESDGTQYVLG